MKTITQILALIILSANINLLKAQDFRELTFYSICSGSGFKSSLSDYQLGYSFRNMSTLIVSGYLGTENCGIEHIFTVRVDSNEVMISETIIDTLLATCTCYKRVQMEIDSFYFEQFSVSFNGELLMDTPKIGTRWNLLIYPNPTQGKITIELDDYNRNSEIDVSDCYGRIVNTKKANGLSSIHFDLSNFTPGVYLVRIRNTNETRIVQIHK